MGFSDEIFKEQNRLIEEQISGVQITKDDASAYVFNSTLWTGLGLFVCLIPLSEPPVPGRGVEPPRPCEHIHLKDAWLPLQHPG